ncbi:hypothetical protein CWI78_06575 [Idiomarina ramblicola]|uniref:JAB domain-containing protein n=1 Tax=Idiomarina ramblicola TaxID=263724 RepID=A0A432Z069_9GAMM|nr:hypothetical protein CWI78_06575 [Idiomarina ramblicola]
MFYEEDKALFYLGDWHSHPTSSPQLSWKDKRTLSRIANTPESNCINPLMVIFGSYPEPWNINCVQYKRASRRLLLFDSCEYEQLNLIVD